jgi:hypothetical protein
MVEASYDPFSHELCVTDGDKMLHDWEYIGERSPDAVLRVRGFQRVSRKWSRSGVGVMYGEVTRL